MKAYIVLPIYNVSVDSEVLNTELIDNYKIISNKIFFDEYKAKVIRNDNTNFAHLLEEDIAIKQVGMIVTRPLAQYLIIKEYDIENDYDNKVFANFQNLERGLLNHLLLALRLAQKGRCQVNRCYQFTPNTQGTITIDFSTNLECMYNWLSTDEVLFEDIYEFTSATIQKLKETCLIVRPYSNEAIVPVDYFMQYYNTTSTYDRIIKLAIVLESSVLAGLEQELNYRLKLRASAFLRQDCRKMLDILYQLRSCIVHNGYIKKECFDVLKKFLKDKDCSDTKALFVFIKDYIEPLVREILYKAFEEFSRSDKIKNFDQLFKKIDDEIFNKITEI